MARKDKKRGKSGSPVNSFGSNKNRVILIIILTITFLSYYPSLQNDFTNWDDPTYVTENDLVTNFRLENIGQILSTPVSLNYHPLTILSLAIDYQLAELVPSTYHRTNLILHLLNTLLVFILIYLICDKSKSAAAIVSLFFGIHPMHV